MIYVLYVNDFYVSKWSIFFISSIAAEMLLAEY